MYEHVDACRCMLSLEGAKASEGELAQKRAVSYETFKKWHTDLDREYLTVSWLDCDTAQF